MTIQKKSLISTLNTTKKAIVANSPAAGSAAPGVIHAGTQRAGTLRAGTQRDGTLRAGTQRAGTLRAGRK